MTREGRRAAGEGPPALVARHSRPAPMIVGFYQFAPRRGDPEGNRVSLEQALRGTPLDLLVCPELATTGYLFLDRREIAPLAEAVPDGPTCARLAAVVKDTGRAVVFGIAERAGERLYNSAVLLAPGTPAVCYRKAHLFDREKEIFDRAGASPRHGQVAGARIGLMVCFDWRFPEMARLLALEGAEVLAHPANLVHPYCQDAMITRSLENGVYTITSSRTGMETVGGASLRFTGRSQIVSPRGERLAVADETEECVRTAEIDPARARDKHVTDHNDLFADRRPELYGPALAAKREPSR